MYALSNRTISVILLCKMRHRMGQKPTTFYIVRHGETDWNKKGIIQGQSESHLTMLGKRQAKSLAKELETIKFDVVISSDLSRSKETTKIIVLKKRLKVLTNPALRERKFGKFEGRKNEVFYRELQKELQRADLSSYEERRSHKLFPDVETDKEIVARFLGFLKKATKDYRGKLVLVVTHGGLIKHFLVHLGFAKEENLPAGAIKKSGYVKLSSDGKSFKIEEIKDIERKEVL